MSDTPATTLDDGIALEEFLDLAYARSAHNRAVLTPEENLVIESIVLYVTDHFLGKKRAGHGGKRQKYVLGLALSFINLAEDVKKAAAEPDSFSTPLTMTQLFKRYRRDASSRLTLSLHAGNATFGIRAPYDQIADLFQHKLERTSFPHAPGDATGKWHNHKKVLLNCFQLSASGRREACRRLIQFGMKNYPRNTAFSQLGSRARLLRIIIDRYPHSNPNEEAGSVYHAIAYGLLAADRPHLRLITEKSRGSSKRQLRIGDIDCYYGPDLELALEVKDLDITTANLEAQVGTFKRAVRAHGVMGMVFARKIDAEAVAELKTNGIQSFSEDQLKQQLELWDWRKQDNAVLGMLHYLAHIEQRPEAFQRLLAFIHQHDPHHDTLRHIRPLPTGVGSA